jgi:hypothetical protein
MSNLAFQETKIKECSDVRVAFTEDCRGCFFRLDGDEAVRSNGSEVFPVPACMGPTGYGRPPAAPGAPKVFRLLHNIGPLRNDWSELKYGRFAGCDGDHIGQYG